MSAAYIRRCCQEEYETHKEEGRYKDIPHINDIINHATESGTPIDVKIRCHIWFDFRGGVSPVAVVTVQLHAWNPSKGIDTSLILGEIWPEVATHCPDPSIKVCNAITRDLYLFSCRRFITN